MMAVPLRCCCVCSTSDARALVDVDLLGGEAATLCGSHALMYRRLRGRAKSHDELRSLLDDRRAGAERRTDTDELGEALLLAFASERRATERRRA